MDLFVVPTAAFRLLYGFIILRHDRRRIVHFGVTEHPTSIWIAQQITEAFPWGTAPRYLIRDRDGVYGKAARERLAGREITEVRTAPRLHWKSPHVEWVIGSIRRECLDPGIRAGLLPSLPMSLVARKGCARWTTRAAGRQWRDRGVAASRRARSPIPAPRGLSQVSPWTAETVEVHHRRRVPGLHAKAGILAPRRRAIKIPWRRGVP